MSAAGARRVASTAFAAVALALVSAAPAAAAPPQCTTPPPQTVVEGLQLILGGSQFCSDPDGDLLTAGVGPASHGVTFAFGEAFVYTPDPGYTGPDEFTLTASDGTTSSDPVMVSITVTPNQPPSCPATRNFHVLPNTPASFDPREGCSDDAGPLETAIVDAPEHGTMAPLGPPGLYAYTPDTGYQGSDTFTIALEDHLGESDQVIVAVTIGPNHAPMCATPVTRQVAVGGTLILDLRNSCADPDGDAMSAVPIEFPSHGQISPGIPPIAYYTAEPGYSGTDRIVYRVQDVFGAASNDAVLDLVIADPTGPNHAPTCVTPVTRQVAVGGTLALDLGDICADPDGDAMSAVPIEFPSHGQISPGIASYTADPGYTGADRIVYRVHDLFGAASSDAVLDLVIADPPVQQQAQTQAQTLTQTPDTAPPVFDVGRRGAQKLAAVRRTGLKLQITCDEAGTATIELRVTKRMARRLRIASVVGRVTKGLTAGDNDIVVPLSRRAKRRLASVKRVEIVALVIGRDAAGNSVRETLKMTLRR